MPTDRSVSRHHVGDRITPLILTRNEEANIGRTLAALDWAKRVVVLDSGSTDETPRIARTFHNVDWRCRAFDTHAKQWGYGIHNTNIDTDFILALDADMIVPTEFIDEFETSFLVSDGWVGGTVGFRFLVNGRSLIASVYPRQLRVFRRDSVILSQVGHSQRFDINGPVYRFGTRILHDDRKPLDRWIDAQVRYSLLEQDRIVSGQQRRWRDRLRYAGVMPYLAGLWAYVRAGGPFVGKAALQYALGRIAYEALLGIRLLDNNRAKGRNHSSGRRSA